jgi:hypothetical protein
MAGFSLRIFLPNGSPDGLGVAEKPNWTRPGAVCPGRCFPRVPAFTRSDLP